MRCMFSLTLRLKVNLKKMKHSFLILLVTTFSICKLAIGSTFFFNNIARFKCIEKGETKGGKRREISNDKIIYESFTSLN